MRRWLSVLGVAWLAGVCATGAQSQEESRFLKNVRQLTYEGLRSGEGYFSPDGKKLIFQSEREPNNPFFQIYTLDLETGDTVRVSPGMGKTTCAFFRPGADELLFASTHEDPNSAAKQKEEYELRAAGKEKRYSWDYDPTMEIYAAHQDGSGPRKLTDAVGYDAEGAYSPDGKQIVFCSTRSAYPPENLSEQERKRLEVEPSYFGEIYIASADGTNARRLTNMPGYDGGPFFSPDGQRIVWRRFDESGAIADIYTMKLDGSDIRKLTDFGAMSWAPYYHPSGQYLIFASNKLGFSNFELYLVDAEGRHEPVRITMTDGFDGLPVFSPDGTRLAWTSNRSADHKSQIWLADWDSAAAQAALAASPVRQAPASADISAASLKSAVETLASDSMEGRMTGTDSTRRAAEYITGRLGKAGYQTKPQEFPFTAGMELIADQTRLELSRADQSQSFAMDKDFRPLSFSGNGEAEGEVVFAGYGLTEPGDSGYDSYRGLDVKDKIVLVLRYAPEGVEMKRRQELNLYSGLRFKAMQAREHGARAILVVTGPNSPGAGELVKLDFDTSLSGSGILAASISLDVARALLGEQDLKALQGLLDTENPHAQGGLALAGVKVRLAVGLNRIKKPDNNVIGVLPPSGAGDEYVLLGAHYDHLGTGASGNSLAHKGEEGQTHNGADDNASGVAVVLEVAEALARRRQEHPEEFQRGVIVALWSGEELGLVGSSFFVENPTLPLDKLAAALNFDMVGRLRENKLILQGIGSSAAWKQRIEKRNVAAAFSLVLQEDPYLPTDATSFYLKKVPILNFFTGSHEDYHRPTDDADKLDYEGMERIAKLARGITLDLLKGTERLAYSQVQDSRGGGGDRDSLRAYLGTIPDYTSEGIDGVKLSGVRGGGPADKAGLKEGDVIVEFGGKKITNIYDYTYALDAVKIGQAVSIVILRDGQRQSIEVVPEARK